jgi:hypothetical protein
MRGILQHRGTPMQASLASAPGVACLTLARGEATASTDDGGIWLAFDGELYDREALLERGGNAAQTDAANSISSSIAPLPAHYRSPPIGSAIGRCSSPTAGHGFCSLPR